MIFAIPTLMHRAPRFPGPDPVAAGAKFVPIAIDFETEGHYVEFRMRVDGKNLEPTAGGCRRWFLRRGAREGHSLRRSFCDQDEVRFHLAVGVPHRVELVVGSLHTVAKRVVLESGAHPRWQMPIATRLVELSIEPEPGSSYTLRGSEESLQLRQALGDEVPTGTKWDPASQKLVYRPGVEVGRFRIQVVRDDDRRIVEEVWAPLYSGGGDVRDLL